MIWSFPISNCLSKSIEPCFATTKIILFTYLKKKITIFIQIVSLLPFRCGQFQKNKKCFLFSIDYKKEGN